MQMYGSFDGFPLSSALFGSVSYNDDQGLHVQLNFQPSIRQMG